MLDDNSQLKPPDDYVWWLVSRSSFLLISLWSLFRVYGRLTEASRETAFLV